MAKTVEDIEEAITQLPQEQLRQFRAWYEKFDSDAWDKQMVENSEVLEVFDSFPEAIRKRLMHLRQLVGRSRYAEKSHVARLNLQCNLNPQCEGLFIDET